jgi:ubiquinone/menaquinone biosynthesis C-methylase UbiE
MKDPAVQNQAAYDQIAASFAERNAGMLPYVIACGQRLLASVGSSGTILDLGCGAGRDMAWFEAQGAAITGADLSFGMLVEARRLAQGPLLQADMRFLPFAAGCFSAVWCQAALLHLPKDQTPSALVEIRRILIPGGMLHVAVQKGSTEGFETRPYEPVERYYAHYQPEELTGLLQAAGFQVTAQGEAEARRSWLWTAATKA